MNLIFCKLKEAMHPTPLKGMLSDISSKKIIEIKFRTRIVEQTSWHDDSKKKITEVFPNRAPQTQTWRSHKKMISLLNGMSFEASGMVSIC